MARTPTKVNFLVAGTQKGGTTALDEYLRGHPAICMAKRKEVHFFDKDDFFQGPPNYSAYHAFFKPNKSHCIIGESTPIYMYWKASPKRIWEYNPEMKLIVVLRNPVHRAYSHWNMERERGQEKLSFWDAINCESSRCETNEGKQHRVFSYIDRGLYAAQIQRLWQYFPRQQTLFIRHEQLKHSLGNTLATVADFLKLSPFPPTHPRDIHSRPYLTALSHKEKEYLLKRFSPDISKLESMLNWDCSDWKS